MLEGNSLTTPVIPLGKSCLPRKLLYEGIYGWVESTIDFDKTLPFDYCITDYEDVRSIIQTQGKCLHRKNISVECVPPYDFEIAKINNAKKWLFPNETDLLKKYTQNENLSEFQLALYERFNQRFSNLTEKLQSSSKAVFLLEYHRSPELLVQDILNAYQNLSPRIILLNFKNSNKFDNYFCRTISSPFPGSPNLFAWWDPLVANSTKYKNWREDVVSLICGELVKFQCE